MDIPVLKAEPRQAAGTKIARRLRASGKLPLIIYGHGEPPECISLDQTEVESALAHGVRTLELDLNGAKKPYLIKEVQYDHLDRMPIHIDLARVDLNERVTVRVSIELRGIPRGVSEGGVLDQLMQHLDVDCLVTDIPRTLQPAVNELGVGDSLLVKDLDLPRGVKALTGGDDVVAMVRALVTEEESTESDEGAGEAAVPERIGRVRKDEQAANEAGSDAK